MPCSSCGGNRLGPGPDCDLTVTGFDVVGATPVNDTVTMTGTGFETGMTVTVDGTPALNLAVVSDTEATFNLPELPQHAGEVVTVPVVVTVGSCTAQSTIEYWGTL